MSDSLALEVFYLIAPRGLFVDNKYLPLLLLTHLCLNILALVVRLSSWSSNAEVVLWMHGLSLVLSICLYHGRSLVSKIEVI